MTRPRTSATGARPARGTSPERREPPRGGPARLIGDVVPAAIRGMALPPRAQVHRIQEAWARVADPSWGARAVPVSLSHGTLFVGVSSASLRDELARFHAERLLRALATQLPTDRVVALRFVATAEEPK
ncbi:MAG: DUF721 domain-containing protein [Planctomycetota bacterium]